jgi:ElaB/YqjD/DUF883 family membrane-anchored ribosome-binding protein
MASDAIASATDSIKGAVDSVAERATAATQWASATVDTATRAPADFLETGAEYIRARPYVAVGAAFALGYLVAKLRLYDAERFCSRLGWRRKADEPRMRSSNGGRLAMALDQEVFGAGTSITFRA